MKNWDIQDSQITASSQYNDRHRASNARLDYQGNSSIGELTWVSHYKDVNQWIQVDFGIMQSVSGTVIQGRPNYDQWVTKYNVQYSTDGTTWQNVTEGVHAGSEAAVEVLPHSKVR